MNEMVLDLEVSDTVLTRMEVSKITEVPDLFVGTTVGVTVGVKVWTGSLAAFSQVACQIIRFYGETYRTDGCGIRGGRGRDPSQQQ